MEVNIIEGKPSIFVKCIIFHVKYSLENEKLIL